MAIGRTSATKVEAPTMVHDVYQPTLRALRLQLEDLDERRHGITNAIKAIMDLPEPPDGVSLNGKTPETVDGSPSYPSAAEIILREAGAPLHLDVIAQAAAARGWFLDKDFINNRAHRNSFIGGLDRKAREGGTFYKPEPVTYGLREWQAESQNGEAPAPETADAEA